MVAPSAGLRVRSPPTHVEATLVGVVGHRGRLRNSETVAVGANVPIASVTAGKLVTTRTVVGAGAASTNGHHFVSYRRAPTGGAV